MNRPGRSRKSILQVCFLMYGALMLWLLFGRSRCGGTVSYWEQVPQNLNLVPFRTIRLYLYLLLRHSDPLLHRLAVVNLAGNVLMFIPLGFFLSALRPKLRALWRTLLATALIICLIETAQLFLLVGSCDVDDLILNVIGSGIGYAVFYMVFGEKADPASS